MGDEEVLEGAQSVGQALGVVETVDAEDDLQVRVAHQPRRVLRQLLKLVERDADGQRAHLNSTTTTTTTSATARKSTSLTRIVCIS